MAKRLSLKIDVDTREGMENGVPRMLDRLKGLGVRATFFLSFGTDNSGKAIWNVFKQKGFLKKMRNSGGVKLYGLRTVLSGTLLPARPIASCCRSPSSTSRLAVLSISRKKIRPNVTLLRYTAGLPAYT